MFVADENGLFDAPSHWDASTRSARRLIEMIDRHGGLPLRDTCTWRKCRLAPLWGSRGERAWV